MRITAPRNHWLSSIQVLVSAERKKLREVAADHHFFKKLGGEVEFAAFEALHVESWGGFASSSRDDLAHEIGMRAAESSSGN
jgi:hypothetical protein